MINVLFLVCSMTYNADLNDHVIQACAYEGMYEISEPREEDRQWVYAVAKCLTNAQNASREYGNTWACMAVDATATDGVRFHKGKAIEDGNG